MKRVLLSFIIALLIAAFAAGENLNFPIDKINETLSHIAIDTSDCSFRTDWVDLDTFRLDIIDRLTEQPLQIPGVLDSLSRALLNTTYVIGEQYQLLASLLMNSWLIRGEVLEGKSEIDPHAQWPSRLSNYVDKRQKALAGFRSVMNGSPEFIFARDSFPLLLMENEKDVDKSIDELDRLQKLNDSLAIRFAKLGTEINLRTMLTSSAQFILASMRLLPYELRDAGSFAGMPGVSSVGRVYISEDGMDLLIGGTGNDRYEGKFSLIIDLGGDDEYNLEYDPEHPSQLIIDCSGNDRYTAKSDHVFGAGFFGCSILDDWEGNDTYVASNFSLGCGMFGTGILIDRAGNDIYRGDICTQGAGAFGVGMLIDNDGRDRYESALYSQGFGFIMGVGALVDAHDNDIYVAGQKYGDILRYEDHYLSLSQGFGYGLRPHMSGGVGLLVDGDGNDTYIADIFGQGASYWFGLGGLIDYQGNDNYIAYQYAQGAATHLCLAALLDIDGNDLYSSKGVSQGCGHDLAFGLLYDQAGDDQYSATDLSQAAGSANGIGMLIDAAGSDAYLARVDFNTHGYGNPRRDFGSIGLFLDLRGKDFYRGYGKDNSYWVTPSRWGIGADIDSDTASDVSSDTAETAK